jgi:predicted aspartyl protease
VGRFAVPVKIANNDDLAQVRLGLLEPAKVRQLTIDGLVDSGASRLVLPPKIAERLGLRRAGKVRVQYADGRRAIRDKVEDVYLEIMGRHGTFSASIEPKRRTALIGAIVLEELDYLVDGANQRLVPRDPRYVFSEIE